MKITPNQQLQAMNTFGVVSSASYFIELESEADAALLARDEYFTSLPFLIMGGGSNLLFLGDVKGVVLRYMGSTTAVVEEDETSLLLRVEAGRVWHEVVLDATRQGLWGVENLALIPGDAGAAAVQNIGAYGAEIAQVIERVRVYDLIAQEPRELTRDEMQYAYRHSLLKSPSARHLLVTAIYLRLQKLPSPNLKYAGLQELQEYPSLTPSVVADKVIQIREQKLPNPETLPNGGSFFMNPVVEQEVFGALQEQYPAMPYYKLEGGRFKIPAAWLIQEVGMKGLRSGEVGTYPLQPLVLVNYGTEVGRYIADFAEEIQSKVAQKFGIALQPEVRYIISAELDSIDFFKK